MTTLANLTARELEILQLVVAGKTNKAIAREVYISAKTVEFHLDHIYTKLGVRSRTMAGIWAIQQGIEAQTSEIPSYFVQADCNIQSRSHINQLLILGVAGNKDEL